MSKDKHKSRDRRLALLHRALQPIDYKWEPRIHGKPIGLALNCIGGTAHTNPDLQRLIRDGMMRIHRAHSPHSRTRAYAPKRFRNESSLGHCMGRRNTTYAVATPKGEAYLAKHEIRASAR